MNRIRRRCLTVLTVLWACGVQSKEVAELDIFSSKPSHCTYARAHDMYGAQCAGLQLNKLPSLKSGIEILDFTENRLRELKADTFSSYTSIKYLYLADNVIFIIEEETFSPLTYLETLDLSRNALMSIPNTMFNLPSLRNLYLGDNPLIYLAKNLENLPRPISAPLEQLDLSECRLINLPDFGMLPQLRLYNVSHNQLISLKVDRFVQMCNLKKVDLSDSIDNVRLCDLKQAIMWLDEKKIYFELDNYARLNSYEFENCPQEKMLGFLNDTYSTCKSEYIQVHSARTSRRTWLSISLGLAGFLVGFILLLYIMHRRNVAQTKNTVKKPIPVATDEKYATTSLLGDAKT